MEKSIIITKKKQENHLHENFYELWGSFILLKNKKNEDKYER